MLSGGAYLNLSRKKGYSSLPGYLHNLLWFMRQTDCSSIEDTFYIVAMKSVNLLFILNCLGVRSYLSKGKRNDKYRSGKINTSVYQ